MFTILFHRQSLFQDILILQDSTAVVQAANLSFQASGFGCSPGRDVILYFAEARTLTFTVDHIALEESNIIRHNKFVTVLTTITSTLHLLMIYLARSHSGKLPSSRS